MLLKNLTTILILAFSLTTLIFVFSYGPLQRIFIYPGIAKKVETIAEINKLWESNGIKGRVLVVFARHLNSDFQGSYFEEYSFTDLAIHQGMIRTIYHVIPDIYWPEVINEKNIIRPDVIQYKSGFMLGNNEGRKYFIPLSKFKPLREKALVIIDAHTWNNNELEKIYHLVASGTLRTDILTIRSGSSQVVETFRSVVVK